MPEGVVAVSSIVGVEVIRLHVVRTVLGVLRMFTSTRSSSLRIGAIVTKNDDDVTFNSLHDRRL